MIGESTILDLSETIWLNMSHAGLDRHDQPIADRPSSQPLWIQPFGLQPCYQEIMNQQNKKIQKRNIHIHIYISKIQKTSENNNFLTNKTKIQKTSENIHVFTSIAYQPYLLAPGDARAGGACRALVALTRPADRNTPWEGNGRRAADGLVRNCTGNSKDGWDHDSAYEVGNWIDFCRATALIFMSFMQVLSIQCSCLLSNGFFSSIRLIRINIVYR